MLSHKDKGKGHIPDIAPLSEKTSPQKHSGMARIVGGFHSFTCTPTRLSTNRMNHLHLPSQPKLVLIYRSRRDGRLSWSRRHYG